MTDAEAEKVKSDKEFLEAAETERSRFKILLEKLTKSEGCELLLRRGRPKRDANGGWRKVPLADEFSAKFRQIVSDQLLEACGVDLTILAYGATAKNQRIGVTLKDELSDFFDSLPKRGSAPDFDQKKSDFSAQDKKCIYISLDDGLDICAFGPSGTSAIGKFGKSKVYAIWNSEFEIDYPKDDLLEIGNALSFFVLGDYVFVLDEDGFASATGYYEITKERSKKALAEFDKLEFVDFSNARALSDLVDSSPDFAKRLSASAARGFIKNLDINGLRSVLSDFASDLKWSEKDDVITIDTNFKGKADKKAFKNLLAQVYVYCAATNKPLLSYSSEPFGS